MASFETTGEYKPTDPELLRCQVAVKVLCDEILAEIPDGVLTTSWTIPAVVDAEEVQRRLRSSKLGDLMLADDDTLSALDTTEYHPELGLLVGMAALVGVSVRAWGWEYPKHRIDPKGPKNPPYKIIHYPGEKDWMRQLDISLHYEQGKQSASQIVTTQTYSRDAGVLPLVSRDVHALAYAEMGYEGHNQKYRTANDESEVEEFVELARELINKQTGH